MATWIFQGNPKQFEMDKYLSNHQEILWAVRQKHFVNIIQPRDEVFMWRADGGKSGSGGILARAIVTGLPETRVDTILKYWKTDGGSKQVLRVPLEVQEVKLTVEDGFLKRLDLKSHPILKTLRIHKLASETNYRLSDDQATMLKSLWHQLDYESEPNLDADELTFPEGRRKYKLHRSIERNSTLIQTAKLRAKQQDPMMRCTVCEFSFYETYGEVGLDYIEAHHIIPISELPYEYEATIEDIALVCSNCHRLLHRKRPWIKIETLKHLLEQS